jgi:hypothetical protein
VEGDQRRRRQAGGSRHRGAVGKGAAHGATAEPSRDRSAQRRCEQEDAEHGGKAELPADICGDARLEGEQDRSGDRQRVEARGSASREGRQHAQRAHHPRPLDRRTGSRQRNVDDDQRQDPDQARTQRHPQRRQQRHQQEGEQGDVLTADREQVAEAGPAEVLDRPGVESLVLAEDEAARQRRLARRHPIPQRR